MAVIDLSELNSTLAREQRVMGLDLGSKIIGVALSDVSRTIASPLEGIHHTKFGEDAKKIKALIDEHDVGAMVIGLPISMDGSEGPRCQSARTFARNILEKFEIPITFWDERLSTSAVERMLVNDVDMTRKRRKEVIDKLAATYILQGALDGAKRNS
ncbi:MAG: Holliday junction resolvase RuvX [Rhodospirillaceae bacterium]|nr:Holliday junction resolvase RuvX [Rhodospirillaceae bacterium]